MEINFEKSLADLEEIVKKIENKDTQLNESINLFNQGVEISKSCIKILEENRGKITLLINELNGSLSHEEFNINA